MTIDEAHPFPLVSNLSVNLLLRVLEAGCDTPHVIRIKVPTSGRIPRFMRLDQSDRYVPLEEVIANNLDLLLPGAEVLSLGVFESRGMRWWYATRKPPPICSKRSRSNCSERRFATGGTP